MNTKFKNLIPENLKSAMAIFLSSMSMPVIATPLCDDDNNSDITAVVGPIFAAGATMLFMKKFKEVMNKPSSNVWRIRWKYLHCRDCNHYFKTYDKLQYFCNQSCSYSFAMDNHIRPPLRWTSALIPCENGILLVK